MSRFVSSHRGALILALAASMLMCARCADAGNAARATKKAPAQPTAEQILERYVQACGGHAAFDSIRSRVYHGTVDLGLPGLTGDMESYWSAPSSFYQRIQFSAMPGASEFGMRDTLVWTRNPGQSAQRVTGDQKRDVLAASNPFPEIAWRQSYRSVRAAGLDSVDARPAFRVELTDLAGHASFADFDPETGLLVRSTTPAGSGGIPSAIALPSDYRAVGSVRVPFRLVEKTGERTITTTWEEIQFNVSLPPSRFEPPAEVKAGREP